MALRGFLKIILASLFICFVAAAPIYAHFEGPERIADNKYTITISVIDKAALTKLLRFVFVESRTAKRVQNASATLYIKDNEADAPILSMEAEGENGVIEFEPAFPRSGEFLAFLEFTVPGDEKIYKPEAWSIWAADPNVRGPYIIDSSVIAGAGLALAALAFLAWNFIRNRRAA